MQQNHFEVTLMAALPQSCSKSEKTGTHSGEHHHMNCHALICVQYSIGVVLKSLKKICLGYSEKMCENSITSVVLSEESSYRKVEISKYEASKPG